MIFPYISLDHLQSNRNTVCVEVGSRHPPTFQLWRSAIVVIINSPGRCARMILSQGDLIVRIEFRLLIHSKVIQQRIGAASPTVDTSGNRARGGVSAFITVGISTDGASGARSCRDMKEVPCSNGKSEKVVKVHVVQSNQ